MRLTTRLFVLVVLASALSRHARAQEFRQPATAPRVQAAAAPTVPAPVTPPPAQVGAPVSPYAHTVPAPGAPVPYPVYYPHSNFWWGWGWGWYPVYAYPVPPPPPGVVQPAPHSDASRIFSRLSLYGAWREDGYVGGIDFGLESRTFGMNLDATALASEMVTGPLEASGSDPAAWGTAHLTWSILSDRAFRLRLEAGGSMLALPESPAVAVQPWRGSTIFGPDFGVSGQIGLVGPIGIEGHARLTPYPVRVADTYIGGMIHGGPVGLSAGWRWIDVAGDGVQAPALWFRGPQVGLSIVF